MVRFPIHVVLLLILGCGTIHSSAISLKDKLKELESRLETKINLLEAKNVQLEEKVTQLETQLEQNNEERKELKSKVQQQETILSALLNEKKESLANLNNLINTRQSQVAINGLPSSCADLKMIGHIWSGFYSVMGNTTMESVYCDFTKLTSDAAFQKWIGYVDVKSTPVYFLASRTSRYNTTGVKAITFNFPKFNIGNGFDAESGIFTAPRSGTYFFSFKTEAEFPASSTSLRVTILLISSGEIARAEASEINTSNNQYSPLTLMATINLEAGDEVYLVLSNIFPGVYLNGDGYPRTVFTGFLLEEEIVASL